MTENYWQETWQQYVTIVKAISTKFAVYTYINRRLYVWYPRLIAYVKHYSIELYIIYSVFGCIEFHLSVVRIMIISFVLAMYAYHKILMWLKQCHKPAIWEW